MLPRQAGVTAFVFTVLAVAGLTSATSAGDIRTLPMQFELVQEGPASACGDKCRTFISAVGAITKDTPSDFATFARDRDVNGATLVLDSSGGSTLGTLALGRNIRRLGVNTTVGKLTKLPPAGSGAARVALSPRADCESMCAYLLLAGKQRFVPAEAQVLVHEIWLGDRREDAAAASYSAEDLMIVQRDIGKLAQYTIEMGGSIDLLETSLRIPPWEPMRRLQPAELRSMGLDTSATPSRYRIGADRGLDLIAADAARAAERARLDDEQQGRSGVPAAPASADGRRRRDRQLRHHADLRRQGQLRRDLCGAPPQR